MVHLEKLNLRVKSHVFYKSLKLFKSKILLVFKYYIYCIQSEYSKDVYIFFKVVRR